jgi:hypothetical protein
MLFGAPAQAASYYGDQLDLLKTRLGQDPELRRQCDRILDAAREVVNLPLVKRAPTFEDLQHPDGYRPGGIDARTWKIAKINEAKAAIFALASADVSASETLARELPLLAAAWRLTGDEVFRQRLVTQLREFVQWDPLQRPGWTLYNGTNSLPPDGNDGVWLTTGIGLVTLGQVLNILPPGSLPADVHAGVLGMIDREINRTMDDWRHKRAWYMSARNYVTNQWVDPFSGLLVAAAAAGRDKYPEAYELGVANLTLTLDTLGTEGACSEGATYAMHRTAPYIYLAAVAAAEIGDTRLSEHGFLKNFPTWLCLIFQPGENVINAFDSWMMGRGLYHTMTADVTQLTALSRSPQLSWILKNEIKSTSRDLYGLLTLNTPDSFNQQPPLWGSYDRARWTVWRSSWADDASGVWVRGGHSDDFHTHHDRGHVNFIVNGKPLLIESGTSGYDNPQKGALFDSVVGHNVLQVGDEILPALTSAPIRVARLNAGGGELTVNAGGGHANVKQWLRQVRWDARTLAVIDEVSLLKPEAILFRWHFGSNQPLAITTSDDGRRATITLPEGKIVYRGWNGPLVEGDDWVPPAQDILLTPGASITIDSDQPVVLRQEVGHDHTLKFRQANNPHTMLVVSIPNLTGPVKIRTVFTSPTPPIATVGSKTTP